MNNERSIVSEKIALNEVLAGNKFTELRKLVTLERMIKCEWENQLKTTEIVLFGE